MGTFSDRYPYKALAFWDFMIKLDKISTLRIKIQDDRGSPLFIYWNDFIRRETIDNNNKGNNRYALHNGINKLDMKSKHHQSIPYETLFQHILGIFQV